MSNFEFLTKSEILKNISDACLEAEKSIGLNNVTCAILSRRALEIAVKWLYANDSDLKMPYQDNISSLVHDITFKRIIDGKLFSQIIYIIKLGNIAVHSTKKIQRETAKDKHQRTGKQHTSDKPTATKMPRVCRGYGGV